MGHNITYSGYLTLTKPLSKTEEVHLEELQRSGAVSNALVYTREQFYIDSERLESHYASATFAEIINYITTLKANGHDLVEGSYIASCSRDHGVDDTLVLLYKNKTLIVKTLPEIIEVYTKVTLPLAT